MATNTYIALDKKTVTGSAAASVEFLSIPQTYTDLVVVINGQVSANVTVSCQLNADTGAHYSTTELFSDGSILSSFRTTNNAQIAIMGIGAQVNSGSQWMSTLNFQNYSNATTYKTVLARTSATATGVNATVSLWRGSTGSSTEAITSIKFLGYAGASSFTVGTTFSLYGIKAWEAEATPKATGGYVYSDSSYWYHSFPFSSTFTPLQSLTADYLVIGGGGAGGSGGGAGAYRTSLEASPLSLTAQAYTITIGAGGASETTTGATYGTVGGDSIFSTITSSGGGYGGQIGTQTSPNKNGVANGNASGGGSGTGANATGGAAGTYGNKGGDGSATYPYPPAYGSGGGGGAGSAGGNGTSTKGGDGGAGKNVNATWATVTGTGVNGYYAGGGTGYAEPGYELTAIAGSGGGGSALAPNGVVSTGSGGGALTSLNGYKGGNGGSGLVIIRYAK
jgi:hypothetical protein